MCFASILGQKIECLILIKRGYYTGKCDCNALGFMRFDGDLRGELGEEVCTWLDAEMSALPNCRGRVGTPKLPSSTPVTAPDLLAPLPHGQTQHRTPQIISSLSTR